MRELGVSKQARSQLIDTLVVRGYLERADDPDDRRKLVLTPTERGRAAAAEVRAAVVAIDEELARLISSQQLRWMPLSRGRLWLVLLAVMAVSVLGSGGWRDGNDNWSL